MLEWDKLVEQPQKAEYFVEAFGAADALLDSVISQLFLKKYSTPELQSVMGVLIKERKLDSKTMLRILVKDGIATSQMLQLHGEFLYARNKVLHETYAEYQLAWEKYTERKKRISSKEELYSVAIKEAKDYLNKGKELFTIIMAKVFE